jgi:hypothetical protein
VTSEASPLPTRLCLSRPGNMRSKFHQTERSKTKRPTHLLDSDSEPRNATRTDLFAANWEEKTGFAKSAALCTSRGRLSNSREFPHLGVVYRPPLRQHDFAKELGGWEDWGEMQRLGDLRDGVGERVVEWAELFRDCYPWSLRRVRTGVTWLSWALVEGRGRRRRRKRMRRSRKRRVLHAQNLP